MMFVHPTATYTRNNKNFNHTSVPKYISFVITNFITSILDNLWEITNLNDEISTVNPRKFEKKKKKKKKKKKRLDRQNVPTKVHFFFAPLAKGLLT